MKKSLLIIVAFISSFTTSAQVSEGHSGIKQMNISKKGTNQQIKIDDTRGIADKTPPVIKIILPILPAVKDSAVLCASKTISVKGRVIDSGGIYDVIINGIEAKVSSDGIFQAEVPLAIGKNHIKVKARDIYMNLSEYSFYSDRLADRLPEQMVVVPTKIKNLITINYTSPGTDNFSTPNEKFQLQGCVKGNTPVKSVNIYRNHAYVNGYVLYNNEVPKQGCVFTIDEPVTLKFGKNEIETEVITSEDTIIKIVTIEYSFYAARNFALIIANAKYDDPGISELDEPLQDAQELYNILTKQYNFDTINMVLLKNPNKAEIIGTLHKFRSKITSNDNLLIFYAGHGVWDEGMGVGYWLPRDAEKNNPVNWLPNTDLTNYLGAIKSKHTLLIADACFSGGIFKSRAAFSATYAVEKLYQLNSRKAITSGTLTEVPDKSVFFQYLLKNLKDNTNDYISAEELFSNMRIAVINNSRNVPQFGTIQNVGDEGGDFIFIKRKK